MLRLFVAWVIMYIAMVAGLVFHHFAPQYNLAWSFFVVLAVRDLLDRLADECLDRLPKST